MEAGASYAAACAHRLVEITVTGPSYTSLRGIGPARTDALARARIAATIEERDPTIADETLG
jgi:hypothetical protein